ncbi:MAG TPA: aldo/keto reductase [Gemmatimonadaceae bacterium]|nr:aldo/keto reductase [Gemmatimonadaceae bacterium]
MEQRVLGASGTSASLLGLGGNRLLATSDRFAEAQQLVSTALASGINYFDTAPLYQDSELYLGRSLGSQRHSVFLATKTHARDKASAINQLEESLLRLKTDYVDLWQLHDVRTPSEVEQIFGPGGAIEALAHAREAGKVRLLGVTGHRDPEMISRCLERFDFDIVMVPVNAAEPQYRSFLDSVIPAARARGTGIVAMYPYCGGQIPQLAHVETVEPFLRFTLSQDIDVALVGCDSMEQLDANIQFAERFVPMPEEEQRSLVEMLRPDAMSLMYYKGLAAHDKEDQ